MGLKIEDLKEFILKDRRKSDRLLIPVKIFYSLFPHQKWEKPVSLEDISGHGLNFVNDKEIITNTEVKLKIAFPEKGIEPIIVKGMVMWSLKAKMGVYHIGVKFSKMYSEDRKRFVEYICGKILLKHLKNKGN